MHLNVICGLAKTALDLGKAGLSLLDKCSRPNWVFRLRSQSHWSGERTSDAVLVPSGTHGPTKQIFRWPGHKTLHWTWCVPSAGGSWTCGKITNKLFFLLLKTFHFSYVSFKMFDTTRETKLDSTSNWNFAVWLILTGEKVWGESGAACLSSRCRDIPPYLCWGKRAPWCMTDLHATRHTFLCPTS